MRNGRRSSGNSRPDVPARCPAYRDVGAPDPLQSQPARPCRFRCTAEEQSEGAVRRGHGRPVTAPGAYRKRRGPDVRGRRAELFPSTPLTRQCPRSQAHQAQARARTTTAVNRAGRAHANKREALPMAGRQGPAEDGGEAGAPLARQAATPLPPTIHTVAQSKSTQARPAGDSNVEIGKGPCASANGQTEVPLGQR